MNVISASRCTSLPTRQLQHQIYETVTKSKKYIGLRKTLIRTIKMSVLPPGSGIFPVGTVDFMSRSLKLNLNGQNTSSGASIGPDSSISKESYSETLVHYSGTFIRFFYPTDDESSKYLPVNRWIPDPSRKYLNGFLEFFGISTLIGFMANFLLGSKTTPSYQNAPLISTEYIKETQGTKKLLKPQLKGKFPVVVFSHGKGGTRTVYSSICNDLASRGFVVASVEHRDGSASGTYNIEDGSEKWIPFKRLKKDEDEFTLVNPQVEIRTKEVLTALEFIKDLGGMPTNLQKEDYTNLIQSDFDIGNFKGKLDLDNVAVVGHSFGGATVINTLAKPNIFKCGVCMDIWMLPVAKETFPHVKAPLLYINSETFHWRRNLEAIFELNNCHPEADRPFVTILGSHHQSASDVPFLIPQMLYRFLGVPERSDPQRHMQLHRDLTYEFLKKYLDIDDDEGNPCLFTGGPQCPEDVVIGNGFKSESQPLKSEL